jgi:hypothetical protein
MQTDFIPFTDKDGRIRKGVRAKCPVCGKDFVSRADQPGKTCSDKCRSTLSRQRVKYPCDWCGKFFEIVKSKVAVSKSGLRFCSRICKDTAQRLESGILALQPPHYGSGKSSESYRAIAFRAHGKKCNRCGYAKFTEVLDVHHKDRNRENWSPENLEVLCPTCHREEHFLAGDERYGQKFIRRAPAVQQDLQNPATQGSTEPLCHFPGLPEKRLGRAVNPLSFGAA